MKNTRILIMLVVVISIAYLVSAYYITSVKILFRDDVLINQPAVNFFKYSELIIKSIPNTLGLEKVYLLQPFLHTIFQAGIFELFGIGLLQIRLPAVIFHFLSSCIMLMFVNKVTKDHKLGLLSFGLMLFSPWLSNGGPHPGRMDAMAIFLGISGLFLLYFATKEIQVIGKKRILSLSSGIAIGLGCIVHPTILSYAIIGIMFLLIFCKTDKMNLFIYYAIGGILGVMPWFIFILFHLPQFQDQFLYHAFSQGVVSENNNRLYCQLKCLLGFWRFPVLPMIFITSTCCLFFQKYLRKYLILLATVLFLYLFVMHSSHALSYHLPFIIFMVAILITFKNYSFYNKIIYMLIILTFLNGFLFQGKVIYNTRFTYSYSDFIDKWQNKIEKQATVAAPANCWLAAIKNENKYYYSNHWPWIPKERMEFFYNNMPTKNIDYVIVHQDQSFDTVYNKKFLAQYKLVGYFGKLSKENIKSWPNKLQYKIYKRVDS